MNNDPKEIISEIENPEINEKDKDHEINEKSTLSKQELAQEIANDDSVRVDK